MSTKQIIADYYAAWIAGDRDRARSFLADNLVFRSPNGDFDSADRFFDACWQYSSSFNEMKMLQEAYGVDAAYIAFEFNDIRVGEFHQIEAGKIAKVFVTFNPTV